MLPIPACVPDLLQQPAGRWNIWSDVAFWVSLDGLEDRSLCHIDSALTFLQERLLQNRIAAHVVKHGHTVAVQAGRYDLRDTGTATDSGEHLFDRKLFWHRDYHS